MKRIAIVSLMALTLNLGATLDPKPMHIRALNLTAKIASFTGAKLLVGAKHIGRGAKYVGKGVQSRLRSVDWEKRFPRTINAILYTSDKLYSAKKSVGKVILPPIRFFTRHTSNMIDSFKDWISVDQY